MPKSQSEPFFPPKEVGDDDEGSAFSDASLPSQDGGSAPPPPADPVSARGFYRSTLRIRLPPNPGSPPYTSPASPAEATQTATTTTAESPRTAIYRGSESAAFTREMEECTSVTVLEQRARQSALAFLNAEIPTKAHLGPSHHHRNSTGRSLSVSMSHAVSGSFEMAEVPSPPAKKKAPLQQLFATRTRKQRSTLSTSSAAFAHNSNTSNNNNLHHSGGGSANQREVSTALDATSGADQDSPQRSPALTPAPRPDSGDYGSSPPLPYQQLQPSGYRIPPPLSASHLGTSPNSSEQQLGGGASTASPPAAVHPSPPALQVPPLPPLSAAGAAAVGGEDDEEDSSSAGGTGIGMEAVLRDASKIRGIRLTWLLYLLLVMVIVLFTLLLVQIIYESNRTLTRTATQAVRAQASSLLNSIDMQEYALTNVFELLRAIDMVNFNSSTVSYAAVRENFCARLYGTPMAYAMYNATGSVLWRMRCPAYPVADGYRRLPRTVHAGIEGVRITDYTWDTALAIASFHSEDNASVETFVMLMDKNTLGRTLMGNSFPQYSSATLQYVTAAFFSRMWNLSETALMFHTLTESKPTYVATENGTVRDGLLTLYHNICYEGSPYIWHTVSEYAPPPAASSSSDGVLVNTGGISHWAATTTNSIPLPHLEYGRAWSQLSAANLCGVQCFGMPGDTTCDHNNPTNVWFVIEYSLRGQNSLANILNVVGAVSIVALVVFSFVMFLVYLSITVPVNFLRGQLLKAVGAADRQTPCRRKIVGWTYRLWLGDLTAIVRSIHILSLCFRLNKKYVPDHVLRLHAEQLYVRRRTFNFLDDVDLKDDDDDREDTESESDVGAALHQLTGVPPAMAPQDSRFLWHFSPAGEVEDAGQPAAAADGFGQGSGAEGRAAVRVAVGGNHSGSGSGAGGGGHADGVDSNMHLEKSRSLHRVATFANDSNGTWPMMAMNELDGTMGDGDPSQLMATLSGTGIPRAGNGASNAMAIRRESESTMLCVRIPSVELAYLLNYSAAVVQHRRIMRVLLHRIRRHKGALFHRSGDCLAAVWNAFEGCPNHAETAAICAQEIANAFAPFRVDGLHVGVVLHQGVLVCGTVEYSKAAFVTAFGDGPREAFAIADLAATVGSLNIVVTEPVKQALSGLYDCNIVDVVQLPNSAHPMLLFELGGSRSPFHPLDTPSLSSPLRAQFAVEYARAFSQFRNHEFGEALRSIEHIRLSVSSSRNEHLLRRLERMCFYYATKPATLPFPYTRPYPVWPNYEAIAQAGLRSDASFHALRNNSLLTHSFMEGVVYKGVPTIRNDVESIQDFKQELQENMRRTARKGTAGAGSGSGGGGGQSSSHNNATATTTPLVYGGGGSPTMDESSTRPHRTPQSSPPMRAAGDLTTVMSERVLSVGSAADVVDADDAVGSAFALLPPPRHVDPYGENESPLHFAGEEFSSPTMTTVTSVPMLTALATAAAAAAGVMPTTSPLLPQASPLVQRGMATPLTQVEDASESRASTVASSVCTVNSPRDVFALSSRFEMTHRVTNRPPVALAAASPDADDLTAERVVGEAPAPERHGENSSGTPPSAALPANDNSSNSIIQSAGNSFRNSAGGGGAAVQSFSVNSATLPLEIKTKSGTTYLRSTRILGKGSFGCVYLGMDAHSGRLVAIKFLPMPCDETGMEEIEAEVLILQRVSDTHVVQLLSYAFEGDTIVIVMECMLAGSLQNMISAFGTIPSSTARVFMRDVLRGLSKIHSMGVIHRDVKPQNVLLSLAGNCKISDFGASAWLQELARKETQGRVCGTPVYLAPEAARGSPAKESDIWSCGIMFLQMVTGVLPYPPEQLSAGAAALVFQIGSGIVEPVIPADLDELDAEFVKACLHVDPSKRLTASALLQLLMFTV